MVYQFSNIILN